MSSFETNILKWVAADNKLKSLNDAAKKCREDRKIIEDLIQVSLDGNETLKNSTVKLNDSKLSFGETTSLTPLTYKFIEQCLTDICADKTQVAQVINHIKQSREIEYKPCIKRCYTNM